MFYQVQTPREELRTNAASHESAGAALVPDHQLVLRFTSHRRALPRLSAKLDQVLLKNNANQNMEEMDDNDIDPIAALELPETLSEEKKPNKNKGVPRSKRSMNYGQSKADLTRGVGMYATGPGGQRIRLDQYGGQLRRRRHRVLELRGHTLGGILSETQDLSRFLVLRDFQMPEIIARWQKYFLRAVLCTWHHVVVQAKEDMLRFRKMFIKSDRELMKRAIRVLRHEADSAMAQRANSQLNNHGIEDEEKSKKIRDLVVEEKRQRAKITSLELQNDSLTEERGELLSEVKRLMGLLAKSGTSSTTSSTTSGIDAAATSTQTAAVSPTTTK